MTPDAILRSDVLDIVFENRNKQYGAYELRKFYNRRLLFSVGLMLATVTVFTWLSAFKSPGKPQMATTIEIPDGKIIIPDVVKPATPTPVPKMPKLASVRNMVPHIVVDSKATDTMPTQDQITNAIVSSVTSAGEEVGPESIQPATGSGKVVAPASTTVESEPAEPAVTATPEFMPEYPGGMDALRRFLSRNLRMPESGIEPGQRFRIPVTFIVNRDGKVSDAIFPGQGAAVFQQEILRVLSRMPAWKAGSQHGKPIAVYYTLPVIFEMGEE